MAKAKSPKLHLSLFTSFQMCRPKKPCSMIKSPLPHSSFMLSPLNSKTFDISFSGNPVPPPSTPSSKIVSLASAPRLDCGFPSSFACSQPPTGEKMHGPPPSSDSDDWRSVPSSRNDKKKHKSAKYKSKSCIRSRTASSSEDSHETDSLFSHPPSFNSSASSSSHHPLKTVHQEKQPKPRRFKRFGSKEWREGEECGEKKAILGRLAPCMSGRKVEQSFVVVKKSVDPYEDFKRSMSEMIVEKQIFEPKELEQLLMSFLSLNSRLHHKVIIEAFTEILKEVFCG